MPRCVLLEKGCSITIDGGLSPCCQFEWQQPHPTDYQNFLQLREQKNQAMQSDQWIPECRWCHDDEKFKGDSMRDHVNKTVEGNFWELWFNNTCNLACRMCNAYLSSTWQSNIKHHEYLSWHKDYTIRSDRKFLKFDKTVFFQDLPNVKHLKILGGEPLLTKEVKRTLMYVIENNFSHNIHLHLTTNLTQPITDEWKDIFNAFQSLFLIGSVDGLYKRYQYIRPGANFNNIMQTVDTLKNLTQKIKNFEFSISCTGQTLNAVQNNDIKDYWKKYGLTCDIEQLYYPKFMSYRSLHPKLRDKFGIKTTLNYEEKYWIQLLEQMQVQDKVHNKHFKTECPELFEIN